MKNVDDDDEDMKEMNKEVEREKRGRERGEKDEEATGKEQTQTRTPNTYALARMTLVITVGCLCYGPSRRFQGSCRFNTGKKRQMVGLLGPWFKTGRTRPEKEKRSVHVSWSSHEMAALREHAHALQHVTAKVQPCQAVLRCQSRRTDGLEAPRLEIFMQRAPQR